MVLLALFSARTTIDGRVLRPCGVVQRGFDNDGDPSGEFAVLPKPRRYSGSDGGFVGALCHHAAFNGDVMPRICLAWRRFSSHDIGGGFAESCWKSFGMRCLRVMFLVIVVAAGALAMPRGVALWSSSACSSAGGILMEWGRVDFQIW